MGTGSLLGSLGAWCSKGKLKLGGCLVTVPGSRGQTPALPYFSAVLNFMTPGPSSLLCGPPLGLLPLHFPTAISSPAPHPQPCQGHSEAAGSGAAGLC